MVLQILPKHEKERERMNLGKKKNKNKKSVSYIVYISNGWKIISDKAVNFFCPYKNTTIFFFFFKASL